ncbi:MAG: hypothetical protein ACXVGN_05990 [Mycobacteriaceae bacterium]
MAEMHTLVKAGMDADGLSTREVATHLAYSERTIKGVIQDLTLRLHAPTGRRRSPTPCATAGSDVAVTCLAVTGLAGRMYYWR